MTCKKYCIHYPVCKDTVADENWTTDAPKELRDMFSPEGCTNFAPNLQTGYWEYYSTTMMECSICKKHVPRHRYRFCPECGSLMSVNQKKTSKVEESWEQLVISEE